MTDSQAPHAATEGAPAELRGPALRWLNRTVVGIGLASLFSDVGHEMAMASMPALLASLGSSSLLLGAIEGACPGCSGHGCCPVSPTRIILDTNAGTRHICSRTLRRWGSP